MDVQPQSIKQQLQKLLEGPLQEGIIMPLLRSLGCIVYDNRGPEENGKDIIYKIEHFLLKQIIGAVVLKIGRIDKGVTCDRVKNQVAEAMREFTHPSCDYNVVRVSEILVITSGNITPKAWEDIRGSLIDKSMPSVHWIDGDELERLISRVINDHNNKHGSQYVFSCHTFADFVNQLAVQSPVVSIGKFDNQVVSSL